MVEHNPDVYVLRKGWEEIILVLKGNTPEYLEEEKDLIIDRIRAHAKMTKCKISNAAGTPKVRIADIQQSFVEAWASLHQPSNPGGPGTHTAIDKAKSLKIDKHAVENFLRTAVKEDFDSFFDVYIQPLSETALKSFHVKNYLFMDILLAAAKFVSELGGELELVIPALHSIEADFMNISNIGQLREQLRQILASVLAYRDHQNTSQYWQVIQLAREYIDHHFTDPNLSLNRVAAHVNLSPSYFSVVYSQETGQTFKEYLTEIRIKTAKELLRMTNLGSTEISYRVGYSDPHYFSHVFGKHSGVSPKEFRKMAKVN
jgi:two-component system, response regulator YesN